tara:strand:+ start:9801 stop:10037 length:237 start_codon:yes stop_codon:yes gene_type:complete
MRQFIRKNTTGVSIIIFILLFSLIQIIEPGFLYDNGTLRQFGIGSKKKTVLPIWLLSIILGILSYLAVIYYISIPKIY